LNFSSNLYSLIFFLINVLEFTLFFSFCDVGNSESSECESAVGENVFGDMGSRSVDYDFFAVDNVHDDCEFAGVLSEVNVHDSAEGNEDFGVH